MQQIHKLNHKSFKTRLFDSDKLYLIKNCITNILKNIKSNSNAKDNKIPISSLQN